MLDAAAERTIYCVDGDFVLDKEHIIHAGDSVQLNKWPLIISGNASVLIAQAPASDVRPRYCEIVRAGAHYKVVKPWGYELWINSRNDAYCAKIIHIKAGTQTSLQYHVMKEETNLIQNGSVELVFGAKEVKDDTDPHSIEIVREVFESPVCFHITPRSIHRIVALTDLDLFEVSTPHLDDVIRLQDDSRRGNGRIESEHQ